VGKVREDMNKYILSFVFVFFVGNLSLCSSDDEVSVATQILHKSILGRALKWAEQERMCIEKNLNLSNSYKIITLRLWAQVRELQIQGIQAPYNWQILSCGKKCEESSERLISPVTVQTQFSPLILQERKGCASSENIIKVAVMKDDRTVLNEYCQSIRNYIG